MSEVHQNTKDTISQIGSNNTPTKSLLLPDISIKTNDKKLLKLHKLTREDLSITLEEMKRSEEYICIENINIPNNISEEWSAYVKKQFLAREKIINFLYELLKTLLILYRRTQTYSKYFQLKSKLVKKKKELNKQKREKFRKKKKNKKISKCTQTDDTSYNWDYHNWYNNYGQDGGMDGITEKTELENENIKHCCVVKDEPERTSTDAEEQQQDKKVCTYSEEVSETPSDSHILGSDENQCSVEHSDVDTTILSKKEKWDATNIKEEVEKLAGEITNKLGYVFMDDIGMYYDYSSGYYYDHKTSLYYDGKTGTYFYYDYDTNKYEFYAQVSPTKEEGECSPGDGHRKKKKSPRLTQIEEKEEGECSDSEDDVEDSEQEVNSNNTEDVRDVAPSLRLMVMNGNLQGSLHIVTLDGGTIGREGNMQVLIKDPSVSKAHAEIVYKSSGPSDHHYLIQDLGSINGTTVQGRRLSDSRTRSEPIEIGHGWKIKCGDVMMSCHIHPGLLTCNECEPGLVSLAVREDQTTSTVNGGSKKKLEKARRRQNKAIRKKFSLERSESTVPVKNFSYRDRAEERRETVGSDNPYEKTEMASVDTNIARTNKGFQLLEKMGWSEGQGLGVNDAGVTEPIIPMCFSGRAGFGSAASFTLEEPLNANPKSSKVNMLKIMKEKSKLVSPPEASPVNHDSTGELQRIHFTAASNASVVP